MVSIWALFSCNSREQDKAFTIKSNQDSIHKIVKQTIFGEVTTFNYSDFNNLKDNKNYDRFLIGKLKLPTGKVVCTDPMYRELGLPQSWTVPKGNYPVYIYIGLEEDYSGRIAYAELIIKDEIPSYWELSLISETLLSENFEKKLNGMYPIEAGLSCFADFETYKIYDKQVNEYHKADTSHNYYNDKLEKLFKEKKYMPKSSRGEDWINYQLENTNRNIIMFSSGYGDGLYPRYVGYDKNGNVVKFITDFIQIIGQEENSRN